MPRIPPSADAGRAGPIPAQAGIGLRPAHVGAFLTETQPVAWIEVHSENYLCPGGPRLAALEHIRRDLPLSCHGVGLSLGSATLPDAQHIEALKAMFVRFQPALVSEHLSWSVSDGVYLNDLLPLPLTEETLSILCRNIDHAQRKLGRQILIENPSGYVRFAGSTIPEAEAIAEIVRSTGCGVLLDVNNVHVSAVNHGFDPHAWLDAIPAAAVQEIHLAGHAVRHWRDQTLLVDDHGSCVADPVWRLYERALARTGGVPTLIEWDTDLPALEVLLGEAAKADAILVARTFKATQASGPLEASHAA